MRRDYRAAGARQNSEMALSVAQRAGGGLHRPALRLAGQTAHQLVKHQQPRVGQFRLQPDHGCRHRRRAPGLRKIAQVLRGHAQALAGERVERRCGDGTLSVPVDAEGADSPHPLDQAEQVAGGGPANSVPDAATPSASDRRLTRAT